MQQSRRRPKKVGEVHLQEIAEKKGSWLTERLGRGLDAIIDSWEARNAQAQATIQQQLAEIQAQQARTNAILEEGKTLLEYRLGIVAVTLLILAITSFFTIFLIFLIAKENSGYILSENPLMLLISSSIAQVGAITVIAYKWLFGNEKENEKKQENS